MKTEMARRATTGVRVLESLRSLGGVREALAESGIVYDLQSRLFFENTRTGAMCGLVCLDSGDRSNAHVGWILAGALNNPEKELLQRSRRPAMKEVSARAGA